MARSTGAGGGRTRPVASDRCIALSGKGTPGVEVLEEAIEAVRVTAGALRDLKRRGGHEFKPPEPEVRLRAPLSGARGGKGWTVLVRVPPFVTARDAREAAGKAARRRALAKDIRLSPVDTSGPAPGSARPGRDRLPGGIRRTRVAPQHRARELGRRAARSSP